MLPSQFLLGKLRFLTVVKTSEIAFVDLRAFHDLSLLFGTNLKPILASPSELPIKMNGQISLSPPHSHSRRTNSSRGYDSQFLCTFIEFMNYSGFLLTNSLLTPSHDDCFLHAREGSRR